MKKMIRPEGRLPHCKNKTEAELVYKVALQDAQFASQKDELRLIDGTVLTGGVVVATYEFIGFRIEPNINARRRQLRCVVAAPESTESMPHTSSWIVNETFVKA